MVTCLFSPSFGADLWIFHDHFAFSLPLFHQCLPAVLSLPIRSCAPAAVLFLFFGSFCADFAGFFASNRFDACQHFICLHALGNDRSHNLFGSVHDCVEPFQNEGFSKNKFSLASLVLILAHVISLSSLLLFLDL